MIDPKKLNAFFRDLRKTDLIVKRNFLCCSGCAGYELASQASDMPKKEAKKIGGVVFYHKQDTDILKRYGKLNLRYGPLDTDKHGMIGRSGVEIGNQVVQLLSKHDLKYSWSGSESDIIQVLSA